MTKQKNIDFIPHYHTTIHQRGQICLEIGRAHLQFLRNIKPSRRLDAELARRQSQ